MKYSRPKDAHCKWPKILLYCGVSFSPENCQKKSLNESSNLVSNVYKYEKITDYNVGQKTFWGFLSTFSFSSFSLFQSRSDGNIVENLFLSSNYQQNNRQRREVLDGFYFSSFSPFHFPSPQFLVLIFLIFFVFFSRFSSLLSFVYNNIMAVRCDEKVKTPKIVRRILNKCK